MNKLHSLGAAAAALILSSCADHVSYAGGYGGGYSTSRVSIHSGGFYPAGFHNYGYYPSRTVYVQPPRTVYVQPSRSVRYVAPQYRDQRGAHQVSHGQNRDQRPLSYRDQRPLNDQGPSRNKGQYQPRRGQAPLQRDQRREAPSNQGRQQPARVTMASYRQAPSSQRASSSSGRQSSNRAVSSGGQGNRRR